jgi:AcrR family transcriptional regulator
MTDARKSAARKSPAKKSVAQSARGRSAAGRSAVKKSAAQKAGTKKAQRTARGKAAGGKRSAQPAGERSGRRAAKKAATEERIVRAALDLFERRGYEETTTKAIAQRAKVAEGTVFNYFRTKEDIALHFFEQEVDHAIRMVRSSRRLRGAPLEEKLFALVQSQMEYLAPYERFIGEAFVQALRPASVLAAGARSWALRRRYLAFVEELIDEALPDRRPGAVSWLAPQAFWVFYIALLLYWLSDGSRGKESTLAFLDRSLRIGVAVLRESAV